MRRIFITSFWNTFIAILTMILLQFSQVNLTDPIERVRTYTRMKEFDYATWTIDASLLKASQGILNLPALVSKGKSSDLVLNYAQSIHRRQELSAIILQIHTDPNIEDPDTISAPYKKELASVNQYLELHGPGAESILQSQTENIISSLKLTATGQLLPPVLYHSTPLPYALIVSPRDVIRQDVNISLQTDLTLDDIIRLEGQVSKGLNVSALVEEVGGIGTYPTMVQESADLTWVTEVIAHEWVHNYLTLRPLGLNYDTNSELRTMNETTASIAGKEIGAAIIATYYPELAPPPAPDLEPMPALPSTNPPVIVEEEPPVFDFRAEMHATRVEADRLLADGKIDEAEAYMEARRKVLWENGYQIRKLNQAYFAFHGAYADSPGGAAGEDPVGPAVRALREKTNTLAEFINQMSWMTSFAQLQSAVEK